MSENVVVKRGADLSTRAQTAICRALYLAELTSEGAYIAHTKRVSEMPISELRLAMLQVATKKQPSWTFQRFLRSQKHFGEKTIKEVLDAFQIAEPEHNCRCSICGFAMPSGSLASGLHAEPASGHQDAVERVETRGVETSG